MACSEVKPKGEDSTPGSGHRARRSRNSSGSGTSTPASSVASPKKQQRPRTVEAKAKPPPRPSPLVGDGCSVPPAADKDESPVAHRHVSLTTIPRSPLVRRAASILSAGNASARQKSTAAAPDLEPVCRRKLTACRNLLTAETRLHFRQGGHFHRNLQRVEAFVRSVVESEGAHGGNTGSPPSLYVCGGPGVGKTAGVRWCCDELIKEYSEQGGIHQRLVVCYINANYLQTSPDPQLPVLQRLAQALGSKANGSPRFQDIKSKLTKSNTLVLLVVDELDVLVSEGASGLPSDEPLSRQEEALSAMAAWARDENVPLGLIGIANTRGREKYHRLKELGEVRAAGRTKRKTPEVPISSRDTHQPFAQFQETVDFCAYSKEDMVHILGAMMGATTVAKPALEFVATKASQNRGDLRYALDKIREAIDLALSSMSENDLSAAVDPGKPPIAMKHVHQAFQTEIKAVRDTVEGLPRVGKAILVVLATLTQEKIQKTTVGMLRDFTMECLGGNDDEDIVSSEDFVHILSTICDKGLVSFGDTDPQGNALDGKAHTEVFAQSIELGLCLEEVVTLVDNELCKNRLFAELRDTVRSRRDLFQRESPKAPKRRYRKSA